MSSRPISRRRLLRLAAYASATGWMASRQAGLAAASHLLDGPAGSGGARTLFRHASMVDGQDATVRTDMSVFVDHGRIGWIRPTDAEEDPGPNSGLEIVDATGTTVVPGMVDSHCHLTSPGGANYLDYFKDPSAKLAKTAEHNGLLSRQAGVAWLREVGSPTVVDPVDGRRRPIALGIRDRWRRRSDRPNVRSAGAWIAPPSVFANGVATVVHNADELVAAATNQLDQGADLVKLYVQGARSNDSPWSAAEIQRVVTAAHARGALVSAHAMRLDPARAAVLGGVDSVEHGFRLDAELCAEMARRGTYLVTTLTVPRSWLLIGQTTTGTFWSTRAGRRYAHRLLQRGEQSAAIAGRAGVRICAGTDFGGGGSRAGQLAWEVESLIATGMQPWQALGAATWRGGELLGEPDAGRIGEGGPADFFLVDGDPYSDPRALWNVVRLA